jgi:hypothetical protein
MLRAGSDRVDRPQFKERLKMRKLLSKEWFEFVRHSESIKGIVPFNPDSKVTRRHLEICEIVQNSTLLLDPILINGMIVGRHWEYDGLLRSGTDSSQLDRIPDAVFIRKMLLEWIDDAQGGLKDNVSGQGTECISSIEQFTWTMHARLICIHPFRAGNDRTARVILNHLRGLLELPVLIIDSADSKAYLRRVNEYRENHFIPAMPKN